MLVTLCSLIEPFHPMVGNSLPRAGLERMLHTLFRTWFSLSDRAAEEALDDSQSMHSFAGIDLSREPVPDETTVNTFRHLLANL